MNRPWIGHGTTKRTSDPITASGFGFLFRWFYRLG